MITFSRVFDELTWVVELSDNTHAYQDHRPDCWLFLKQHCDENNLTINWLELQFRSHVERIESALGYYILNCMTADLMSGIQSHNLNVGRLQQDNNVVVNSWKLPELIIIDSNKRSADKYKHLLIPGTTI